MSIIERVAELLGSDPQVRREPAAAREGTGKATHDLIERAAGESSQRHNLAGVRIPVTEPLASRPVRSTGKTSRTCKVDREQLRRQSVITPDGERTEVAECFRRIKRQVLSKAAGPRTDALPANLVLVTSALPGEGKTYCAVNLAISIALEMNRTVLLVDADVAKPSVPRVLGLEAGKGLLDLLLDRRVDPAEVLLKVDIGKLTLMLAGTAHKHATELLGSDAMRNLLHEMAGRYHDRIIIFDSPPLLAASEAGILASQVGQIVVVVEAGKTSEGALKDALGRIDTSRVTGLLLNKGDSPPLAYGYGGYG